MIYLDMDGVLCDFHGRYTKLFGDIDKVPKKQWRTNWKEFIKGKNFETLDLIKGAEELLKFVRTLDTPVEILTSSGGPDNHEEVARQKLVWLRQHGIKYKANVVPGGQKKAEFAAVDRVLVDDTPRVIEAYRKAGGYGILHDSNRVEHTILELKEFFGNA